MWIFKTRLFWFGLFALLGIVTIFGFELANQPSRLNGSPINPPQPAPDFILPDTSGNMFQLSAHSGSVVLIFFGYTTCPDVCPATLANLRNVKSALGSAGTDLQVVFITVDPERDTKEKMLAYLQQFDSSFVGLTGSADQLDPVWKSYGVYREKREGASQAGYMMDHSSQVYVIDRQGNLRLTYGFDTPADAITHDMRALLKEKGS